MDPPTPTTEKPRLSRPVRIALWGVGGVAFGLAFWALIGCPEGGCPITSNPYTSAVWGAGLGALIGWAR